MEPKTLPLALEEPMKIFQYTWWLWSTLMGVILIVQSSYGNRVFGYAIILIAFLLFLSSCIVTIIGMLELSSMEKGLKKELHILKIIFCFGPAALLGIGFAVGVVR
jgi:hypothetical protein